jgi:hypothetical protein
MSSNFVRFQEILNQALAENFTCLTQKLANPPLKSGSSFPNRDPLLRNLHQSFVLCTASQIIGGYFALWPSQNILTLSDLWLMYYYCGSNKLIIIPP